MPFVERQTKDKINTLPALISLPEERVLFALGAAQVAFTCTLQRTHLLPWETTSCGAVPSSSHEEAASHGEGTCGFSPSLSAAWPRETWATELVSLFSGVKDSSPYGCFMKEFNPTTNSDTVGPQSF